MAKAIRSDSRLFTRCAVQRYEEAEVLQEAGYTTGAVYLAGYSIECILKALLLASVRKADRSTVLKSFRGSKAHDYDWLRIEYLAVGGSLFPREIARHFALVNNWSTDLRYIPRFIRSDESSAF